MKLAGKNGEVIVCVGSGGVGKTTVATAIAVSAAESGKRVLVMTVDPSKRLATTLGLNGTEGTPVSVEGVNGPLSAILIQPKQIFDGFVKECLEPDQAERLFQNKLYQQLSTNLSGSQEFTSLNLLYGVSISGAYDLVVLDTPPTQHAIDFFEAPQKIHNVFHSSVTKWFVPSQQNRMARFLGGGTAKVVKLLENVTGVEFMGYLNSFFEDVEPLREEIRKRTAAVQRLLSSSKTSFVLVTTFEDAKLKEAMNYRNHILRNGYQLTDIIINRATPSWYSEDVSKIPEGRLRDLYQTYLAFYQGKMERFGGFTKNIKGTHIEKLPDVGESLSTVETIRKHLCKGAE